MQKCKSCSHWEAVNESEETAACSRIPTTRPGTVVPHVLTGERRAPRKLGVNVFLVTHQDFGCMLHEEAEPDAP